MTPHEGLLGISSVLGLWHQELLESTSPGRARHQSSSRGQHPTTPGVAHLAQERTKFERAKIVPVSFFHFPCGWLSTFEVPVVRLSYFEFHCAKSIQGEAPCGNAVYGSWTEMSPAPLPPTSPPTRPPWHG